jgi:hypothetical protein
MFLLYKGCVSLILHQCSADPCDLPLIFYARGLTSELNVNEVFFRNLNVV